MKTFHFLLLCGILCISLSVAGCTTTSTSASASPATAWSGTWNTTWLERDGNHTISMITMTQTGTDVIGNYSYTYPGERIYTGTLNGTVHENTLTGTYRETDNDVGLFVFTLDGDKNSFSGRWIHAPSNQSALHNSTLTWDGVRTSP